VVQRRIKTVNVPSGVADELRRDIRTGLHQPGERLPGNRELAANFGVSMGSIREAISLLVNEGLIETRAGRGTYVAQGIDGLAGSTDGQTSISGQVLDRKQVEELIEARETLELQLVEMAAQRASAEQVSLLRQAVARMEEGAHDPVAYSEADIQFHLTLAEAAGNRVLLKAMLDIRQSLKREMELSAEVGARRHGDLVFSVDSHRRVVDAIEAGDATAAHNELFDIMGRHHEFVLSMYAAPSVAALERS
jgi:GntR family transcriptional repressor for pyruvate dehydrogenase complex